MGIDGVIEVLKAHGITKIAHMGFTTLPKEHVFATYGILSETAQGADEYALYLEVAYQVRIFYRDGKTAADKAMEKLIKQNLRMCDGLTIKYDYDSENSLDITFIEFNVNENF